MKPFVLTILFTVSLSVGDVALGQGTATSSASALEARGQRLFTQCQACHAVTAGAPHKLGPNLHGIVGSKAASQTGYSYSPALQKSGIVWDEKSLDRWLERTSATVPGTKMIFVGIPNRADRDAIIAYLKRTKPAPR